jgi:hypothetical protein
MNLANIEEAIAIAEKRWPQTHWHIKTSEEACSPCPFCGGTDRFLCWANGYWMCRPGGGHCEQAGWLDDDQKQKLTPDEIRFRRLEAEQHHQRRQLEEQAKRLTALERMHQCQDHITYHQQMDRDDLEYWHAQGINDESIKRYLLGVCYCCPTDKEHRPSYTIPIVNHGKLCNIRHRLIGVDSQKYRPHMRNLGNTLFNADNLYTGAESVTIVEGAKKSIVLGQHGLNTVGIMGMQGFPQAWATRFSPFREVLIALDPDAQDKAHEMAGYFQGRGKVVSLPSKPDDFFISGGTLGEFQAFLHWGKPVRGD